LKLGQAGLDLRLAALSDVHGGAGHLVAALATDSAATPIAEHVHPRRDAAAARRSDSEPEPTVAREAILALRWSLRVRLPGPARLGPGPNRTRPSPIATRNTAAVGL
jgi:hypothetical protein